MQGCPLEPSTRIREAAVEALSLCPCVEAAPFSPIPTPEPAPIRRGEESPVPSIPPSEASWRKTKAQFAASPGTARVRSPRKSTAQFAAATAPTAPELEALKGYCIVSLQSKQFVPGKPELAEVFEGRTYHFASTTAHEEFKRFPEGYAPAYSGADPVEKIDRGETIDGKYLRLHQGRFYLFASKENWKTFQQNPDRYVPVKVKTVSGN
jgi:YHS domain-containing protein